MGSMDPNEIKAKELYADNCVRKMGARCVLYIPSKAVYRLDDQTKPEQFAEQK